MKLLGAKRALDKNHQNANKVASRKISAFINEVSAQSKKALTKGNQNEAPDGGKVIRITEEEVQAQRNKPIPEIDAALLMDAANILVEMIDLDFRKILCESGKTKFCDE